MNRNRKRITQLEEQLRARKPKKPVSMNIVMVEEKSIRAADDLLVKVPDETPFPEKCRSDARVNSARWHHLQSVET
jgi:hypothetical protein